jgi:transposase
MGKIIERCAGIDVGKRFLLCCVLTGSAAEEPQSETRRFDTPVPSLERLRAWLREKQVTHVVMESTGSYWIPIFNLLEGLFAVVLANPEEVKTRKGHKTDRKDAEHPRRRQKTSVSTLAIFTLVCSRSFCTRFRSRVASCVSWTRRRVRSRK